MQRNLVKKDFFLFNGVDAYREGNRIPENALYYAENSRFAGGRWASRKGYTGFGDALAGGTNIKGLTPYLRFPAGVESAYVMAYYDSQFERISVDDPNTSDTIVAAGWVAGDVDVEGESYNGVVYLANGVDLIGKITDTTFATIAGSPRARLLVPWKEKMLGVDNVAPSTVQYTATASASVPANIEDWTTPGAAGAELIGKGGRIESLRELNEKAYVFKRDYIEVFTDIDVSGVNPRIVREPVSKFTGAVNHRSTIVVENDIWFLTPNLEIRSLGQEANYFKRRGLRICRLSSKGISAI